MRLLRGGNDREVATIVSGTYPTVLSQFTITNTITKTIITSISSRGSTDELASAYDSEDEAANDSDQKTERQAKTAWEEWALSHVASVGTIEKWKLSSNASVGTIEKWKLS